MVLRCQASVTRRLRLRQSGIPGRSPEEDHLTPLMTAVGAAESEAAARIYHDTNVYGGITASSYRFR